MIKMVLKILVKFILNISFQILLLYQMMEHGILLIVLYLTMIIVHLILAPRPEIILNLQKIFILIFKFYAIIVLNKGFLCEKIC